MLYTLSLRAVVGRLFVLLLCVCGVCVCVDVAVIGGGYCYGR